MQYTEEQPPGSTTGVPPPGGTTRLADWSKLTPGTRSLSRPEGRESRGRAEVLYAYMYTYGKQSLVVVVKGRYNDEVVYN